MQQKRVGIGQLSRPAFTSLLCHCFVVLLWASAPSLSFSHGERGCHYLPGRTVVQTESEVRKERLLSFNCTDNSFRMEFNNWVDLT